MPAALIDKLKQEYGANSKIPYMIANKKGWMHGSKETAEGASVEAKYESDHGLSAKKKGQKQALGKV